MPRATWKGFLRLSLVSCPIYLTPATTRTRSIRLNQVWVPHPPRPEPRFAEAEDHEDVVAPSPGRAFAPGPERRPSPDIESELEPPNLVGPAERIALQPVSRDTGESVERSEVMKGYEYERGQFVTFTPDKLKAAKKSRIVERLRAAQAAREM